MYWMLNEEKKDISCGMEPEFPRERDIRSNKEILFNANNV